MKSVTLIILLLFISIVAGAPLLHADSQSAVPNSYIVILNDYVDVLERDAHILRLQDVIRSTNADAKITFTYKIGSLVGFAATLTKELLTEELSHPDVKYIEVDQVMTLDYQNSNTISSSPSRKHSLAVVTQTGATWGLARISQKVRNSTSTNYVYNSAAGMGVDVYVLDTGILTTHVDFGGRASSVYNAITTETPTDLNGHGTHCAGVIGGTKYGVAKNVTLFSVKVLSAQGSGTTAGIISGINYVTETQRARKSVACLSAGGGISTTLDDAVSKSISSGIVYTITAGGSNADACNFSPGRVPTAVTVGATNDQDARTTSNYGTCISLFAPGTAITSDWIGSNTATNTISGPAQTFAAGALAIRLSIDSSLDPAKSKAWLQSVATPNVVTNPGANSPNRLLFSPYD